MDFVGYKHMIRVVLIKAYRKELTSEEAAVQVKNIFTQLEKEIAKAKKRVGDTMPHLRDGTITVNEAESEILLGE